MSGDFYEDDEPTDDIDAAFQAEDRSVTTLPINGRTVYLHIPGHGHAPAGPNEACGTHWRYIPYWED